MILVTALQGTEQMLEQGMCLTLCFDFGMCSVEMRDWCHSGTVTLSQQIGCVVSRNRDACSGRSGNCSAVALFLTL